MAYDERLLRLAQERYEADRSAREADLAEQREQLYARRPRPRENTPFPKPLPGCGKFRISCAARPAE